MSLNALRHVERSPAPVLRMARVSATSQKRLTDADVAGLLAVLAVDTTGAGRRDRAHFAFLLGVASRVAESGLDVNSCKSAFLAPPGPVCVFATA